MLRFMISLQYIIFLVFTILYAYHFLYLAVGLFGKQRRGHQNASLHRYAAIIAARNEENVIAELIGSLKQQKYPSELLDVIVIADNCTDQTAEVARKAGAIVYERFNKVQVGKGYALDYLFHNIFRDYGETAYDAFIVFDADNIVDPYFVSEMNKMFDTGEYAALTSYRNSKNFCDNWITAGYSLWFLREARYLNNSRCQLGMNCAVSGTGFLVSADVIRQDGGWPYHLLTEDIEFSITCAFQGRRIGYCGTAVLYDEQPTEFKQSWNQRLRWSKGFYQINAKYTSSLLQGTLNGGRKGASCYDMFMTVAPGNLAVVIMAFIGVFVCCCSLFEPAYVTYRALRVVGNILWVMLQGMSMTLLLFGAITMLTEWKKIEGKPWKKLLYIFTFPLFMLTYVPISIVALVCKVEWKPIRHGLTKAQREREKA